MVTAVVQYPTEEQIIVLNKEVLKMIKVRKADTHRVIKPLAIKPVIDAARKDPGGVYDKAATLLMELVEAHIFDSGNRRMAFTAAITFLRLNGEDPKVTHDPQILQGIRERFYAKQQVIEWLKGRGIEPFRRR